MAKVKYDAFDSDADEVEAFGYAFKDGKSTEVKAEDLHNFERGNPFFTVGKSVEAKPAKVAEAKIGDADTGLKAVHNGGGRYVIKDGETVMKDGLTKDDAGTFNAMSDEDKAEYVK